MLKKIAIIGVTGAAIVGTGTAALAASGASTPTPTPTASNAPSSTAKPRAGAKARDVVRLRRVQHAVWVTGNGKGGTFVTHDAIRGTVASVSATSITVTAADKTVQSYAVSTTTKIHTRTKHKGAAIGDVKVGDPALVIGTGTSQLTATQIVDSAKG